jgi:hypothetical protein
MANCTQAVTSTAYTVTSGAGFCEITFPTSSPFDSSEMPVVVANSESVESQTGQFVEVGLNSSAPYAAYVREWQGVTAVVASQTVQNVTGTGSAANVSFYVSPASS